MRYMCAIETREKQITGRAVYTYEMQEQKILPSKKQMREKSYFLYYIWGILIFNSNEKLKKRKKTKNFNF